MKSLGKRARNDDHESRERDKASTVQCCPSYRRARTKRSSAREELQELEVARADHELRAAQFRFEIEDREKEPQHQRSERAADRAERIEIAE